MVQIHATRVACICNYFHRDRCNFSRPGGSDTVMPIIWKIVIGMLAGGALGFAYYRFVGCATGTCPLTSNPWTSTLYGMLLGSLIAGSLTK